MRTYGNLPTNSVSVLYLKKSREYLDRADAVEPKARAHLALYEANENWPTSI